MELYKAVISKKDLDRMPLEEQVCFIQAGRFINDISMLNKFLYFSMNAPDDDIELKARNSQSLSISILLAGKLNECNEYLGKTYGNKKVKELYGPFLSTEAQYAYKYIRKYFNNKNNHIRKIRDKLAFHHDDITIKEQLLRVGADEKFEIYFHEYTGNCLYHISSHLLLRYILNMVDPNNHEIALKSLFTDMRQLVNYCNEFLNDFVRVMALRHGKGLSPLETITIGNPPDINNVTLPYFLSKPI